MPLLTSPIDGSPMKQINRFGIEIDICPTSGGIWLDKGELEKLINFIKEEAANEQGQQSAASGGGQNFATGGGHQQHHHKGHKRESAFEKIMDIFEF